MNLIYKFGLVIRRFITYLGARDSRKSLLPSTRGLTILKKGRKKFNLIKFSPGLIKLTINERNEIRLGNKFYY